MRRFASRLGGNWPVAAILAATALVLALSIDRFYGVYYDNKFFHLLALRLWEAPGLYLYLGSHYHVPSSLYSYIALPFMHAFGPGDLAMELPAAVFHLLTVLVCYRLGSDFHGRATGIVFALLVATAPIHLVQVYTIPDLSFAIFLNAWSLYLFLRALERGSTATLLAAAVVYWLACFQAIYALVLMPFYLAMSVLWCFRSEGSRMRAPSGRAALAFAALALPAGAYLLLLYLKTFMQTIPGAATFVLLCAAALAAAAFVRRGKTGFSPVPLLFPAAALALLAWSDLVVQLDCHLLGRKLGYYIEASVAGGYGGRPHMHFQGSEVRLFGVRLYSSVLTSLFDFIGKDFAKPTAGLMPLKTLYYAWFVKSFPPGIRLLAPIGLVALAFQVAARTASGQRAWTSAYALLWALVAASPLLDLGPDYFNIRRVYLLPVVYLFAAAGAAWLAACAGRVAGAPGNGAAIGTAAALALFAASDQALFSLDNIYHKYRSDSASSMYYKLYYGHHYGRSYKEAGRFLLSDSPPREGGAFRSALVYTIPEDSSIGRSLPLFNNIEWYTAGAVKVIFDFKGRSAELYGTAERLELYLGALFDDDPGLETVYFADFFDTANNFSFFSAAHPGIEPYAVVDDDGARNFDCVLYRFTRPTWRQALAG